jgi:hypothetical protein
LVDDAALIGWIVGVTLAGAFLLVAFDVPFGALGIGLGHHVGGVGFVRGNRACRAGTWLCGLTARQDYREGGDEKRCDAYSVHVATCVSACAGLYT